MGGIRRPHQKEGENIASSEKAGKVHKGITDSERQQGTNPRHRELFHLGADQATSKRLERHQATEATESTSISTAPLPRIDTRIHHQLGLPSRCPYRGWICTTRLTTKRVDKGHSGVDGAR